MSASGACGHGAEGPSWDPGHPPQLCDAGVNAMGSLAAQEGQGLCSWSWCEASTLLLLCYFLLQYWHERLCDKNKFWWGWGGGRWHGLSKQSIPVEMMGPHLWALKYQMESSGQHSHIGSGIFKGLTGNRATCSRVQWCRWHLDMKGQMPFNLSKTENEDRLNGRLNGQSSGGRGAWH